MMWRSDLRRRRKKEFLGRLKLNAEDARRELDFYEGYAQTLPGEDPALTEIIQRTNVLLQTILLYLRKVDS
jgi:hypothetical protein